MGSILSPWYATLKLVEYCLTCQATRHSKRIVQSGVDLVLFFLWWGEWGYRLMGGESLFNLLNHFFFLFLAIALNLNIKQEMDLFTYYCTDFKNQSISESQQTEMLTSRGRMKNRGKERNEKERRKKQSHTYICIYILICIDM